MRIPFFLIALSAAQQSPDAQAPVYEVRFEFEGNSGLSSGNLLEALSALRADLRRQGVDQGAVDDAVYEITRHYRTQGFLKAEVTATWSREKGTFVLRFRIVEGQRSFLEGIVFEGASFFTAASLRECFEWRHSGILGLGHEVFTQEALDEGITCIVARYEVEGFFFAEAAPAVSEGAGGAVRVRVEIREGPRVYLATPPEFEGVHEVPMDELLGALELGFRPLFTPRLALVLKGKLVDFYRNRGYRFAEVQVSRRIETDPGGAEATARLHFKVSEGRRVRIEDVRLHGNVKTWDWVLEKRLKLQAGDLYSEERVRESYRSLLRSGLFSAIDIDSTRVEGEDDRVHLDVTVSEKARYRLGFQAGYGSYELLRGKVTLEDLNLFGTGHRMLLEGHASFRGEGATAEYVNPFFFHERLVQSAQGFLELREHPSFFERRHGVESGFTYRVSEQVRSSLIYRLKYSQTDDVDPGVPPELIENVLTSSFIESVIVDTRNSIVDPERGFTGRMTVEWASPAFGSDLDFVRYTAFASWVLPLPWGLRLVTAARAGVIDRMGDTDVIPIQERFFNGGENTVRSFAEDEAGPKVNGDPIGGETFTSQSVELRFPLLVLEGLQGAAFFDAGTITEDIDDFAGGRYFFAVGMGVRYNTPVGPFRFDAAINPDRGPGEDLWAFHFGLGYPF